LCFRCLRMITVTIAARCQLPPKQDCLHLEHENSFNISRICVPNHLNLIFQMYVYELTVSNFMEAGLFWEATSCSASREIPFILCSQKVRHRVHKSPQLNLILNQMNEVNSLTLVFFDICLLSDSHPRLDVYLLDFPAKILDSFVVFLVRVACTAQFILFNSIRVIIIIIIICGQLPFLKTNFRFYIPVCHNFRNFYTYSYCYVWRLVYSRHE
jgi:hypothetical protein